MSWLISALVLVAPAERPADLRLATEILRCGEKERLGLLAYCKTSARKATGAISSGGRTWPAGRSYSRLIPELQKLRGYFLPSLSLEVGSIGILRNPIGSGPIGDFLESPSLEIFQVVDRQNALAKLPGGKIVWLRGFAAEGIEDGRRIVIRKPVRVTKTTQYMTALGTSKTVLVIEPFVPDPEIFRRAAEELHLIRARTPESPPLPAAGTEPAVRKRSPPK